jgi:hypothetical protein
VTVEEAMELHQRAQERVWTELYKTGRVRSATRKAAIDAALMVFATQLAELAAEPEGAPGAGGSGGVTP